MLKMLFFLFLFVWLRATLPAPPLRPADAPLLGVLLPIGLLNVAITAIIVAAIG